jgi:hypothetical protein
MNFQWAIPPLEMLPNGLPRNRIVVIVGIALFLFWEIATRTLAAYLAEVAPDAALMMRSTNSTALLKVADRELRLARSNGKESSRAKEPRPGESEPTSNDRYGVSFYPPGLTPVVEARIRTVAESALHSDPLNAKAFRILAQLSDRSADKERTKILMQAALQRSLHEGIALFWMMQQSYLEQDYRNAIRYADTLLRTRPQLVYQAMPTLGRIAETRDARGELKKLLARNPPWRSAFFANLPPTITDARTPLEFLIDLKESPTPPAAAELRSYLDFLVTHKFYDLAYYTWLQFLSPEQLSKANRLFNGGFESEPSGLPFDWVLSRGSGSIVKIATRSDASGGRALFMQFGPGRVEFPGVAQLLLLPPGSYELQGAYKVDLISQLGLQWRITCAGTQTPLNEDTDPFSGIDPRWKEFQISFIVPSGCVAQNLRLLSGARSASEKFMSGSVWFDDLKIVQGGTPPKPEENSPPF